MSGLTVLCGSHVRPKGASRGSVVWTNSGVALVQFFLTFLFLLGWIWSIMWGTAFLSISSEALTLVSFSPRSILSIFFCLASSQTVLISTFPGWTRPLASV